MSSDPVAPFAAFPPASTAAARELGGCVTNEEMFRSFNMGWGFALIVPQKQAGALCAFLKRKGERAEIIGRATKDKSIAIRYGGKKIVLR